jgi:hypothetical protein
MNKLWIEQQADSLKTPLPFATWFVYEGVKSYEDVDDALVAYLQSRGVTKVEKTEDLITMHAGVQSTQTQLPSWFGYFADNVGYKIVDWFSAVCELLRLTAEDWSK